MEHGKCYLRVTDREADRMAQKIDICSALVLIAYCTYKGLCLLSGNSVIKGGVENPNTIYTNIFTMRKKGERLVLDSRRSL